MKTFKYETPLASKYKRKAARDFSVFIISAMDEQGKKDSFSQIAPEVIVTAPGSKYVRGYRYGTKLSVLYGRTSPATPQELL